jgi:predicted methyltransferase
MDRTGGLDMKTRTLCILAAGLILAAPLSQAADPIDAAAESSKAVAAAIASPDRPKSDLEQDARRKPAEILAFVGVTPGMHVADMFSAGGYYTELLSRTVGVKGQVVAYNNLPYANFAKKGIAERYAGDRLSNVRQITADIDKFDVAPGSLDAAMFVMSYHDLYWRPADGSWPATDPQVLLKGLYTALKPGAVVVVEDHVANANADPSGTVDKLHRIDPAVVKADFAKAGFVFDAESKVLAHPDDDHSKLVFDDAIRGKTDQFVFRFKKPAKP